MDSVNYVVDDVVVEPTRLEALEWAVCNARTDLGYSLKQARRMQARGINPDELQRMVDALERALAALMEVDLV